MKVDGSGSEVHKTFMGLLQLRELREILFSGNKCGVALSQVYLFKKDVSREENLNIWNSSTCKSGRPKCALIARILSCQWEVLEILINQICSRCPEFCPKRTFQLCKSSESKMHKQSSKNVPFMNPVNELGLAPDLRDSSIKGVDGRSGFADDTV